MPKFTLLTAVHNAAPYLDECIRSVLAQSESSWQLLCVDDASTDASLAILRRYAAADRRITVMTLGTNVGQAAARNRLLTLSRGEWTLMLDADDRLAPDVLERVDRMRRLGPEVDAVVLRLVRFWDDGREAEYPTAALPAEMSGREACLLSLDWRLHGLYAIRTDLHRRIPFDDRLRRYSDDNTARLHYAACRRVVLSDATYYYRQHAASSSHRVDTGRLDFLEANRLLRRDMERAGMHREGLRRLEVHCWGNFLGVTREMLRLRPTLLDEEWGEVRRRLGDSLRAMCTHRLPLSLRLHPGRMPLRPLGLFLALQRVVTALKG